MTLPKHMGNPVNLEPDNINSILDSNHQIIYYDDTDSSRKEIDEKCLTHADNNAFKPILMDELIVKIKELANITDNIKLELCYERIVSILGSYQENPRLMDQRLETVLTLLLNAIKGRLAKDELLHRYMKIFYLLIKTRGCKVVRRMFPHETHDVQTVLSLIEHLDPHDSDQWESRYVLMLWLSELCMIPFAINRFDGNDKISFAERIVTIGKNYIKVCDKTSDAASMMLSKFLTRKDIKETYLAPFIQAANEFITNGDFTTMEGNLELVGYLRTLGLIFKDCKREELIGYADSILNSTMVLKGKNSTNIVLNKLRIKVIQRVGMTLLKNKIASWRYMRGKRSLQVGVDGAVVHRVHGTDAATEEAPVAPPPVAAEDDEDEEDDEDYDIPEGLELVIDQLMGGLRDKDTVVRWSAAKGIGRITNRLPAEAANDIIEIILELFNAGESDNSWHGGCLSLAELSRKGLLLPVFLPRVTDIMIKALNYDEKRGNCSIGSHVRDAACYVCWAFSRAYKPRQIKPYVDRISQALVIVTLFDREVNCRRAASAAFQENVGRQGFFKNGIDIIQACDYHSVGNKVNCFTDLCTFVGHFEEYTIPMIKNLSEVRIYHWDPNIRDLSAQSLEILCQYDAAYIIDNVLQVVIDKCFHVDNNTCHGSFLAMSRIVLGINTKATKEGSDINRMLGEERILIISTIIKEMISKRRFFGFGKDSLKIAACQLINTICYTKMTHSDHIIGESFQAFLQDCILQGKDHLQREAVISLQAYISEYFVDTQGNEISNSTDSLIAMYTKCLTVDEESSRVGSSMALGALPIACLRPRSGAIISSLLAAISVAGPDRNSGPKRIFTRIAAVNALKAVMTTLSQVERDLKSVSISYIELMYSVLFAALYDYTIDHRGDIGALVREPTILCLELITLQCGLHGVDIDDHIITKLLGLLMKQACEKIDNIRITAGASFVRILYTEHDLLNDENKEFLMFTFHKEVVTWQWREAKRSFQMLVRMIGHPDFILPVLEGLAVSVGGLTESLRRHSSNALMDFCVTIKSEKAYIQQIYTSLLSILSNNLKNSRLTNPLMTLLVAMFTNNIFEDLYNKSECANNLLELLKLEIARTKDHQKIMIIGELYVCLIDFIPTRRVALTRTLTLLTHRFPIVRKAIALCLYEKMIMISVRLCKGSEFNKSCGDNGNCVPVDDDARILDILGSTHWDGEHDEAKTSRNKILDILHIPLPVAKITQPV